MFKFVTDYLSTLLSFVYPYNCSSCGQVLGHEEKHICISCQLSLPYTYSHSTNKTSLDDKFLGKLEVKNTYTFLKFGKKGPVQKLLHQLKYGNKPGLAIFLGNLYAYQLEKLEEIRSIDLIVPVPLHEKRFKERGYNQAEKFAEGLSQILNIPIAKKALIRVKYTTTQTSKSRFKRYENLKDVFQVENENELKNARVALVDDVLTTGSTLLSCGEKLMEAGVKELTIITIASA